MFNADQILADIAALDPVDAYRAAAALHWRVHELGAVKALQVVRSVLPAITELTVDMDNEDDDAGCTYRVFNSVTLTLNDGRTLELPDESKLSDGWQEGCCGPYLDAAADERVEARLEATPDLDREMAMLAECGAAFGLGADAMLLLVDACSFLARNCASEGYMTIEAGDSGGPATSDAVAENAGCEVTA